MTRLSLTAAYVFLLSAIAAAETPVVTLVSRLPRFDNPVYITNAHEGSGRLFVVDQYGRILVVQPGGGATSVFLDIQSRVVAGGEQGLLGLAFHPHYSTNGRFFVDYTRQPDGATVVAEYRVSMNDQ